MHKLYFLPISLTLLTHGLTTELKTDFPQVPITSQGFIGPSKENIVAEVDPNPLEDLKKEISAKLEEFAILQKPPIEGPQFSSEKERFSEKKGEIVQTERPHTEKRERPKVSLQPSGTPQAQIEAVQPEQLVPRDPSTPAEAVKPVEPKAPPIQRPQAKPLNPKILPKRPLLKKSESFSVELRGLVQNDDTQSKIPPQLQPIVQPSQECCECITFNTAVRPLTKEGIGIEVMGDALLWQAVEENLTYVMSGNDTGGVTHRNLHTVDFHWDWGFRIAAGYNTTRDGWDIGLSWTHIRNTAHGHKHSHTSDTLYQIWTDASHRLATSLISEAKAHWKVTLEQLDLELGRQFYAGHHLTLRPFVGMRSTWLFQKYDVCVNASTGRNEADMKNRFWGYGFSAGFDTDWRLGCGFSLYGGADMALLLGFFDVDQKGTQSGSKIWTNDKSFRAGRAILDVDLGVKWFHLFCNHSYALTLKAGYEYHLYFSQNQFLQSVGSSTFEQRIQADGDLIYQGLIGSIQFDF